MIKKFMLLTSYLLIFAACIKLYEQHPITAVTVCLVLFLFVYLMNNIKVKNFEIDLTGKKIMVNEDDKKDENGKA